MIRKIIIGALASLLTIGIADAQTSNGRATTAAPTYGNNTTAPLSLDLSGALRVAVTAMATFTQQVVGNVASGAADSGNPVKVGGIYNSTLPTFTNGRRGDMQIGTRGSHHVELWASDTAVPSVYRADNADDVAVSATVNNLGILSRLTIFDGTNWDRLRGTGGALNTIVTTALPAGTNNIGDVDVLTLPSIPAGSNTIGATDVVPKTPVHGFNTTTGTTETCTSVKASAGSATGFVFNTFTSAASGSGDIRIYDNASGNASGTLRFLFSQVVATTSVSVANTFNPPMIFSTGISVCTDNSNASTTSGATVFGY